MRLGPLGAILFATKYASEQTRRSRYSTLDPDEAKELPEQEVTSRATRNVAQTYFIVLRGGASNEQNRLYRHRGNYCFSGSFLSRVSLVPNAYNTYSCLFE